MAARTGLSSTMAIFSAESRCSPDDNAPWFDGSDPLPAAAKFLILVDIPLAWAAHHLTGPSSKTRSIRIAAKCRDIRVVNAAGPPQFAADGQILCAGNCGA
jgi:hypothetical protein